MVDFVREIVDKIPSGSVGFYCANQEQIDMIVNDWHKITYDKDYANIIVIEITNFGYRQSYAFGFTHNVNFEPLYFMPRLLDEKQFKAVEEIMEL